MEKIFGTDGVRGVVGDVITPEFVYNLGKSVAVFLCQKYDKKEKKVLIAHDTRKSFEMIEQNLCKAFNEFGIDVVCAGVMPTPAVHYLTKLKGFDAGVMITASHNPAEYNGVKIITNDGFKASDEVENKITEIFYSLSECKNFSDEAGKTTTDFTLIQTWADCIKNICKTSLQGLKVAFDLANGASFKVAGEIFEALDAQVFQINASDNGDLINKDCGSTHTEEIAKFTKSCGADIGFAFDGDADRVNVCFADGQIMTGEQLMFLCAMSLFRKGELKQNKIVTPNVTNFGVDNSLKKFGIETLRVGVGGKNIQQKLLEEKLSFGAEDNGHIIWADYNKCSDGILTAVLLSKLLVEVKNFDEILKDLKVLEQTKLNVQISQNQKIKYLNGDIDELLSKLQAENKERIVVRPSGTEPLVRIIVEGAEKEKTEILAKKLEKAIKEL